MKTIKILVILYISFSCGFELIKAQIPQKMSNQSIIGIKPVMIGSQDTINANSLKLFRLTGWMSARKGMTVKPGFSSAFSINNNFNLISKAMLFKDNLANLPGKVNIAGFGITDTLKGKLEFLIWQPASSSQVYYGHSTRISKSSFSDNPFYRAAGNIFNFYTETKYPSLSSPKK
jgi:hypothetical protein